MLHRRESVGDFVQRKLMCVKRRRIERAAAHGFDGDFHSVEINFWIPFVRVDDVESTPIPELHVYRARPVLGITGKDESPAFAREFAREFAHPLTLLLWAAAAAGNTTTGSGPGARRRSGHGPARAFAGAPPGLRLRPRA